MIGAIAAYVFLVVPSSSATTLVLTVGSDPSNFGQSLTFTAEVTSSAGIPTGQLRFLDGTTVMATSALDGSGLPVEFTTAALSVGAHSITAAYSGNGNFAAGVSPPLTQVVIATVGTSTSTQLFTSPSQTFFRQAALFQVLVTASNGGIPTGTVVLLDGNTQFGPALPLAGGLTSYRTPLGVGTHHIRAIYLGTGGFGYSGGFSSVRPVSTSPRPKPR